MQENESGTFKVKVNDFEFTFNQLQVAQVDIIQRSPNEFHLLHGQQSLHATIAEADVNAKKQKVEVEGTTFEIQIRDELDQMLDQMGFSVVAGKHIKEIKAPMPGLVLEVNVAEGQAVKEGDKVLILVAMKMENSIMIHADAVIKKIAVKAGQAVDKGQVLVELE